MTTSKTVFVRLSPADLAKVERIGREDNLLRSEEGVAEVNVSAVIAQCINAVYFARYGAGAVPHSTESQEVAHA